MKVKIDPAKHQDKMYGATTMGARGQLVIPAGARKELGLKPGDQLIVLGKYGKVISLVKAEELGGIIKMIMDSVVGEESKRKIRHHLKDLLGPLGPLRTK